MVMIKDIANKGKRLIACSNCWGCGIRECAQLNACIGPWFDSTGGCHLKISLLFNGSCLGLVGDPLEIRKCQSQPIRCN